MLHVAALSFLLLVPIPGQSETLSLGDRPLATASHIVEFDLVVRGPDGKILASTVDRGLTIWVNLGAQDAPAIYKRGLMGLGRGGKRRLSAMPSARGDQRPERTISMLFTVRAIRQP
jgi:hypothetical protein